MFTNSKKSEKSISCDVLACVKALKEAHENPLFAGKTEKKTRKGTNIIISFTNKVNYEFALLPEEYIEYKKLEAGLWK